jgi:lysophospholipase-2
MHSRSFGVTNGSFLLLLLSLSFLVSNSVAMSSSAVKRGALIFLHGLGDSPAGWSHLEYILPDMKSRLKDIAYVFPAAPTIPISINGGERMPGWFDLYDWPIGVGSKDDEAGLFAGVEAVQAEVTKLNDQGIPSDKIVVAGFSQGGAVALLATYRSDVQFAGCAGLSAWLTLPAELEVSDAAKKTPLFWGHGRMDDKVLFPQQKFGVDKLREAGVTVKDEAYDMGHSSHPDEMETFADFVDRSIFGDGDEQEL